MAAYGLDRGFPWIQVWQIMTVDSASGRAVLLAHGVLRPRITEFGDCAGNYTSPGRFFGLQHQKDTVSYGLHL